MTTFSPTARQIADAISFCKALETTTHKFVTTTQLLANCGWTRQLYGRTKILPILEKIGVLCSHGNVKKKWKLADRNYNTANPFNRTGEPVAVAEPIEITEPVEPAPVKTSDVIREKIRLLEARVKELEAGTKSVTLTVKHSAAHAVVLAGVVLPANFQTVFDLACGRRNILLVGPAGCGKTHLGELIARTLGFAFGSVSCTSGMSEAHLLGRSIPNVTTGESVFQSTDFLNCYENGGVFLLDEVDAADPNLMLAINSAIANGYCNVPNRPSNPRAIKHANFIIIATANTFGRGANRMYSGRNQLDEATLDRFRIGTVECDYDTTVEAQLCPDETIRTALQAIRNKIQLAGLRRIMSTRFIADAYVMSGIGWTLNQITEAFFSGWTEDEKQKVA